VTLTGALVTAAGFLRPLRHRAVASAAELAGWAARIAVLWLLALIGLALGARQKFSISLGTGTLGDIGDLIGASPEVGFEADVPQTVLFGCCGWQGYWCWPSWSRPARPSPPASSASTRRYARPRTRWWPCSWPTSRSASSWPWSSAATRGNATQTFALILLGMPNLVWLALTIGLGATWNGRVDGPFGLPVPHILTRSCAPRTSPP
jgi:hypothetical protein